jgi:TolB protein
MLVPTLVLLLGALGALTNQAQASSPGRNGRIFFHSNRVTKANPTGDYEIFTMRTDGSRLRQLTDNRINDFDPSLSADGQTVAFLSQRNGNLELFVMNADGSGQTRITRNSVDETNPALSPDGTRIAFERNVNHVQLFTIDVNGSGETQITQDGDNRGPAWSPDGTRIAFARDIGLSSHHDIYTMNPDGSDKARLTFETSVDLRPNWSPDGQRIAFQSNLQTEDNPEGDSEIFVLQIPIISAVSLQAEGWTQLTADTHDDYEPVWSPNGARILFYRDQGLGNSNLVAVRADGSGERRLTNNPADDSGPDWQPRP